MKLKPVAYRFTENRGNGKTEFSYYSPEQLATAYRDNCLAITPLYAIPEGFAVVPKSATPKMIDAMLRVFTEGYSLGRDGLDVAFDAAIAAAQEE